MSVSGAGVCGEIARGSFAHLAAAIKDDSTYQKRLAEIKAQHIKIALAGQRRNQMLNTFTHRDTALVWAKARAQEVNNVYC